MGDFKIILVPFAGSKDEISALEAAFNLAAIFNSHVRVLHISPDPKEVFSAYFEGYGAAAAPVNLEIEGDIRKRNKTSQKAAKNKYVKIAEKYNISHDENTISPDRASSSFHIAEGSAEDIVAIRGRLADLIVMGRTIQGINTNYAGTIVAALFNSGRPVLITPAGEIPEDIDLRVVIAWNGSSQAARVVNDSMPLLRRSANATKVWVLTDGTDESKNFPITAQDLCFYLKQHNIEAEPIVVNNNGLATGAAILSEARRLEAGMVVIGAFSHSRVREMILGGVTDFVLKNADIPVFMSH